ncbi:hypothetical protein EC900091_5358 [Escherichia coli 90.0091]|nr:hypothetical protein EC900091_5358 [Escherichia coli 90.0091]
MVASALLFAAIIDALTTSVDLTSSIPVQDTVTSVLIFLSAIIEPAVEENSALLIF